MGTVSPGLHTVDAEINGVSVGSVTFAGQRGATLYGSIPAADLRRVDNTLRLSYSSESATGGLWYLGHVDIDAPRLDPPAVAPLRLAPYEPLLSPPRAQYLIVTHPDFRQQANALASLKTGEGYSTAVVEVQQAYDAYSGGIVEARAIAQLIAEVAGAGKLKYVLLIGDDSFDPLNNFGSSSASYIPSLYSWDDEFGRIPSEVLFADVDGDRSPEAIRRLPCKPRRKPRPWSRRSRVSARRCGRRGAGSSSPSTTRARTILPSRAWPRRPSPGFRANRSPGRASPTAPIRRARPCARASSRERRPRISSATARSPSGPTRIS